jgi:hypothetical protein
MRPALSSTLLTLLAHGIHTDAHQAPAFSLACPAARVERPAQTRASWQKAREDAIRRNNDGPEALGAWSLLSGSQCGLATGIAGRTLAQFDRWRLVRAGFRRARRRRRRCDSSAFRRLVERVHRAVEGEWLVDGDFTGSSRNKNVAGSGSRTSIVLTTTHP